MTFESDDIIYNTVTTESVEKLRQQVDRLRRQGDVKRRELESLAEKIGRKLDRSKSEPIYKSARFPEHKIISIPNHRKIKRFIKEQVLNDLEDDLDAWEELLKGEI